MSQTSLHSLHLGAGGRAQVVLCGANLKASLSAEQRTLVFLVLELPGYKSVDSGAGSVAGEDTVSMSFQASLCCGYSYRGDLFCTYSRFSSVVLGVSQRELGLTFTWLVSRELSEVSTK